MNRKSCRKGMVLALVLVISVIVFLLGVSIAGLVTMEGRASLKRSNEIVTRQTALAAIKYGQNLLTIDWNHPSLAAGSKIFEGAYYSENDCYYDLSVKSHTNDECVFIAQAYFKESREGAKRLWARGVEAAYSRAAFTYALMGIGTPKCVLKSSGYYDAYGYYYPPTYEYVYPRSLDINGASIDGKIGTAQKQGEIVVNAKPIEEKVPIFHPGRPPAHHPPTVEPSPGSEEPPGQEGYYEEETRTKELKVSIQHDALLTVTEQPDFVKLERKDTPIEFPFNVPDPYFPYNGSKEDYDLSSEATANPGSYHSLDAVIGGDTTEVGGEGTYCIKNCRITGNGDGKVVFKKGTYYIENLEISGSGVIGFTSGTYYIKNLKVNGDDRSSRADKLTLKVYVVDNKPANLYVTESAVIKNAAVNPPEVKEEPNPQDFFIFATSQCKTNELAYSLGYFAYWNKNNSVTVNNCSVDGTIAADSLKVEGEGRFSCHKEIIGDQVMLTKWEEL
ncbi:MAG: hypothetical protein RDV48_09875 [Candidatus Eremiobacteraeota bacterium]|nr:hypothetical protein [Candidatus Eremiobacteraeota bacterium]